MITELRGPPRSGAGPQTGILGVVVVQASTDPPKPVHQEPDVGEGRPPEAEAVEAEPIVRAPLHAKSAIKDPSAKR
jgi:hypothetical protein